MLDVVSEVTPALGFAPATRFSGPLQATVPDDLVDDLVAVLREALTSIVRHAGARTARVGLSVHDELTLTVVDDGVGIGPTTRRSGLADLQARAGRHRGTLTVLPDDPAGTRLSWSVPIR